MFDVQQSLLVLMLPDILDVFTKEKKLNNPNIVTIKDVSGFHAIDNIICVLNSEDLQVMIRLHIFEKYNISIERVNLFSSTFIKTTVRFLYRRIP